MICPTPPRVRPAPPESGRSSLRQKITGATFSVASTGMVRTPDGKAVRVQPVARRPRAGAAGVEGDDLEIRRSPAGSPRAWPDTEAPPRNGGFHSAEAPSAVTRSGTAWCRQPIIRSGSRWPITWRTDTG